jgi:hypothetical protein
MKTQNKKSKITVESGVVLLAAIRVLGLKKTFLLTV